MLRLEKVPTPATPIAVSPICTCTLSMGTPSSSARIWAKLVSWPWPCEGAPLIRVSVPSGSARTTALSHTGAPKARDGPTPVSST